MTRFLLFSSILVLATTGCDKDAPSTETPGAEATAPEAAAVAGESETVEATQPDRDKLVTHINEHIEYPADRAKVLKACADTDEFNEGEKLWVANNLAEGEYADAAAVVSALGL